MRELQNSIYEKQRLAKLQCMELTLQRVLIWVRTIGFTAPGIAFQGCYTQESSLGVWPSPFVNLDQHLFSLITVNLLLIAGSFLVHNPCDCDVMWKDQQPFWSFHFSLNHLLSPIILPRKKLKRCCQDIRTYKTCIWG